VEVVAVCDILICETTYIESHCALLLQCMWIFYCAMISILWGNHWWYVPFFAACLDML